MVLEVRLELTILVMVVLSWLVIVLLMTLVSVLLIVVVRLVLTMSVMVLLTVVKAVLNVLEVSAAPPSACTVRKLVVSNPSPPTTDAVTVLDSLSV